ncbi:MAG TPA: VOC family protein [Bacteroidales bacterium]|nr:VOC family protein [Bacteroidales bacterium]
MTRTCFLVIVMLMLVTAGCERKSQTVKEEQLKLTEVIKADTTPRVTGIGGIFFFSEDPSATKTWYSKNLGLVTNEYGSVFESRNANRPDEINYLVWTPFKDKSDYFVPSKKPFMINYRVQNLRGLVRQLKAGGVNVLDTIETYDYGKFVHIMDPEGNKIELWEPVDSVLTKMGGKTTK